MHMYKCILVIGDAQWVKCGQVRAVWPGGERYGSSVWLKCLL